MQLQCGFMHTTTAAAISVKQAIFSQVQVIQYVYYPLSMIPRAQTISYTQCGTQWTGQKRRHAKPIFTLRRTGSLHYWHGCHAERLDVTHSGVGKPGHAHVHTRKGCPVLLSKRDSCSGSTCSGSQTTSSTLHNIPQSHSAQSSRICKAGGKYHGGGGKQNIEKVWGGGGAIE